MNVALKNLNVEQFITILHKPILSNNIHIALTYIYMLHSYYDDKPSECMAQKKPIPNHMNLHGHVL